MPHSTPQTKIFKAPEWGGSINIVKKWFGVVNSYY